MNTKIITPTRPIIQKASVRHVLGFEEAMNFNATYVEDVLTLIKQNNSVPDNAVMETYYDEDGFKVYLWSWFVTTIGEDE